MDIKVIPNEQTPRIQEVDGDDMCEYIELHKEKLNAFILYADGREDAAGLAANQVSIDGERFMVRAFVLRDRTGGSCKMIINPKITEYIGIKDIKAEGCLTWKGMNIFAERSRGVVVEYSEMDGHRYIGMFKGFEGQIWQHEINHLNGVEEDVRPKSERPLPPKSFDRNEPCPCGSGKKYKKCCNLLI